MAVPGGFWNMSCVQTVHVKVVTIQGHSIQISCVRAERQMFSAFVDLALCLRFRFGIERRSRIGLMWWLATFYKLQCKHEWILTCACRSSIISNILFSKCKKLFVKFACSHHWSVHGKYCLILVWARYIISKLTLVAAECATFYGNH